MKKFEEKIFDIVIFLWEGWDEIGTGYLLFYNVEFPFESMKKYNGMDVALDMNGEIIICDNDGTDVWKGFACQIPEFMQKVEDRYKKCLAS